MYALLLLQACGDEPAGGDRPRPPPTRTADTGATADTADTATTAPTGDTGTTLPTDLTSAWLEGGPQAYAGGRLSIRDLDGDGAAELAVGGRDEVWVLSSPWADGAVAALADWTAPGQYAVELLPDLGGDGVPDLVVERDCGADVYRGPFPPGTPVDVRTVLAGDVGESFATCGDVDGDGDDDLCVGSDATCSVYGVTNAVVVHLLPLPPAVLAQEDAHVVVPVQDLEVETGGVDLDHDGRDEIVVAAPDALADAGAVWLVRDPPGGTFDLADADAQFFGSNGGRAGSETARGDLDGDGGDDLAIAAPSFSENPGYYYYYVPGPAPGRAWIATDDGGGPLSSMPITLLAFDAGSGFGEAMAVGDLDGDGHADLAISEIRRDPPGPGTVAVHLGPIPAGMRTWADADLVVDGWAASDFFGVDLAIGDLDGDGRDDLAAGGTGSRDGVERSGAVHLLGGVAMFP